MKQTYGQIMIMTITLLYIVVTCGLQIIVTIFLGDLLRQCVAFSENVNKSLVRVVSKLLCGSCRNWYILVNLFMQIKILVII